MQRQSNDLPALSDQVEDEAQLTHRAGITVYAVGITPQVDLNELAIIASGPPDTHVFTVTDFGRLPQIVGDVIQSACAPLSTIGPSSTLEPRKLLNYGSVEGPPRGVENRNLLSHPDDLRMEAYVIRIT